MFKKTILSNGLRVITIPMQGTNTVTALVMVGTGSNYEKKDNNGISHFLEHMFFKGTEKRPSPLAISTELDSIGAVYNAFTSHEVTGYFIKVGAKYLPLALDWLSDVYLRSLFDEGEIKKEHGVILEEMHMRDDDPGNKVGYLFEEVLYGDQPAGWKTIGTKESLALITREGLVQYFSTHYVAANTTIIVAGNINETQVIEDVKKYFAGLRDGKVFLQPPVQEVQGSPQMIMEYKESDQTHIVLGVRAPGKKDSQTYIVSLLGTILGGGMSSRMFVRIREELGLAYAISTSYSDYTSYGYLDTYAGVDHVKAEKAISAILKEFVRVRDNGVEEKELQKVKDYVKGKMLIGLEASDAVAAFIGEEEILLSKPMTIDEVFVKIDSVGVDDIQAVAQEIFRPNRLNLAVIGPFRDKEKFEKILRL